MEHLRWILIVVGVLILIGIILFANPNRQLKPARPRKSGKRKSRQQRIEPSLDGEPSSTSNSVNMQQQSIAGLESSANQSSVDQVAETNQSVDISTDVQHDEQSQVTQSDYQDAAKANVIVPAEPVEQQPAPPQTEADQIVSLYVVASQRHPISGVELLDAALKAGLDFGAQDIFHRLPHGSNKPLFSMANLTAPGYFDRTAWNLFETQGVTLFMTLPGATSALVAWDSMLATAERLAELLKAEVQDKQRQNLTRQTIAHQREAMRAYDRQNP